MRVGEPLFELSVVVTRMLRLGLEWSLVVTLAP